MKLILAIAAAVLMIAAPVAQAASMKMDGKAMKIEKDKRQIHMMDKDNKEMIFDFADVCGDGAKLTDAQKAEAKATCGMFDTMKENDDVSITYEENPNHGDPAHGTIISPMQK